MKIGVFDSGLGGLSVARAIEKELPEYQVIFRHDRDHVPYGDKPLEQLFGFVLPILHDLEAAGCEVIVVACNTVTTNLITELRAACQVPLVAIEPMVKPAAKLTKSGIIAVCATPNTLASPRYAHLKSMYAKNLTVLEPDCSQWSRLIEDNAIDEAAIRTQIDSVLSAGADVIALACTHYHWIDQQIQTMAQGRAVVIQPSDAVISQLKRVIERLA